jgi:hypothetical protein
VKLLEQAKSLSKPDKSNDKLAAVLAEVKQMQVYINQTHLELNNLMGSLALEYPQRSNDQLLMHRV